MRRRRRSAPTPTLGPTGQTPHRCVLGRSQNVIGAVAPQTGAPFSLIVDGVDTDVFQFFLDEMAKAVPRKEGLRQLLILD
jgi:hypothetical protein